MPFLTFVNIFSILMCTHACDYVSQYTIYRTRITQPRPGQFSCLYRNPNNNPINEITTDISTLGSDDLRVIFSPGFNLGSQYTNEWLVNYNIQCPENKLAYFRTTDFALEEECEGLYVHCTLLVLVFRV